MLEKEEFFKLWGDKKPQIDRQSKINHPKKGEIWWTSVGYNIGTEIYGKGKEFTRPVLILNADNPHNFIGIPLSSRIRKSKYNVIIELEKGKISTALVFQIRNYDNKRLIKKIATLEKAEFEKMKEVVKIL
jgi:mRNA interferase MazF